MEKKLKILIATDFSPGSKLACATAKLLQKKYKTDFYWIHVIPSFWKNWVTSGLYQKEARQRLVAWQNKVSQSAPKKLFVKVGNPTDNILMTANSLKTNLILVGGMLPDQTDRYKTGTVVQSIVRYATRPVWVCHKKKIAKILVGVDGSTSSKKALRYAANLSRLYNARLTIISALPDSVEFFGMSKKKIKMQENKTQDKYEKKIKKFISQINLEDIKSELRLGWGHPANILLNYAEDFDQDLIVVGAKGHSTFHYVLLGSTTEQVLRHTPCSLLVIR